MDTLRTLVIIAGAIVAALIVWKIVTFVTGLLFMIVSVAVVVALIVGVFYVARSALRKPANPTNRSTR